MQPITEGYLQAGPHTVHYHRVAGNGRPIVLAHGISDNALCWSSLIPVLARRHEVIAFDAPAHGRSSAPAGNWSIDDQAEVLQHLVQRLELDHPILIGHSMGGLAVFWAAIAAPQLPAAVIFEDSTIPRPEAPQPGGASREGALREELQRWMGSLQRRTTEELVTIAREQSPLWPEADYLPWADSKLQVNLEALSRFSLSGKGQLEARLPELQCPALFLMADAPEEERVRQRAIVSKVPRGRIEHVDGAGHSVRRDQHARFVSLIEEFLTRI